VTRFTLIALSGLTLLGCRGQVSEEPPVVPIRNMYNQPRYDPQDDSQFFEDGRAMRPPVEGAIAVEMEANASVATGRTDDDSTWLLEVPSEVTARFHPTRGKRSTARGRWESASWGALNAQDQRVARRSMIERGHERFAIYCAPCHSDTGEGHGLVAQHAARLAETGVSATAASLSPAVSLHDDRIKHMPDGQLYATITHGVRNMPAYDQSIPLDDRWAIVSYVRALQLAGPEPSDAARAAAADTEENQ